MNKHSPAPWRYETLYSVSHQHDVCLFLDGNNQPFLMTENSISKLDANLIAAAPVMLEALKLVLGFNAPLPDEIISLANSAINKAEGK